MKLRLQLLVVITSLLLVIVLGFSFLSIGFFVRGMDTIVAGNMEKAARKYLLSIPKNERQQLHTIDGSYFSSDWSQMPATIRDTFPTPPDQPGIIQKNDDSEWFKHPDKLHFALLLPFKGERYYAATVFIHDEAPGSVRINAKQSFEILILISVTTLGLVVIIVWLFNRRISSPIIKLGEWLRSLKRESLADPTPDFIYPELNNMANTVRNSLLSVHESLEREHFFLRHISHELRTPISVIRSNIGLIRRVQGLSANLDERLNPSIDRIDRASVTMKHLTHTLLWLSHGGVKDALPTQVVELDKLISEIDQDCRYLLNNKPVNVQIQCSPYQQQLPTEAVRIVVGNLIQNAFQHTQEGYVDIVQSGSQVHITNHNNFISSKTDELGFGLGLRLTRELANSLGWQLEETVSEHGHRVMIDFYTGTPERIGVAGSAAEQKYNKNNPGA